MKIGLRGPDFIGRDICIIVVAALSTVPAMVVGLTTWHTNELSAGEFWPSWLIPLMIIMGALISVLMTGLVLFGGALDRATVDRIEKGQNEIAKGQNEIAKGQNEIAKGQNEIVKGQAEIIRILKERLPLPPASGSAAAAPDSGHGANAG